MPSSAHGLVRGTSPTIIMVHPMSEDRRDVGMTGETPVLRERVNASHNSRSGVSPDMKESLNLG